ncbi:hypothetical protein [Actinoplanes sp. GCM10030250]|uniref:hypothetical protein n=1 Tax=Actinoplanes sp. GCM10030250 TaxID=3273376 RepID=UPI0036166066
MRGLRRLVAGGTAVACVWVAAGTRTTEVGFANRSAYTFGVTSTPMKELHPGAVRRSKLTVSNPYPFAIEIRSITVRLASTSKRKCKPTSANLRVGSHRGRLPITVPVRGRKAAGEFEVTMPNTAADACQKTTFRMAITATATRAKR